MTDSNYQALERRCAELEDEIKRELSYPLHQRDWAPLRRLVERTEAEGDSNGA